LHTRSSHLVRIGLLVAIASAPFLCTPLHAQEEPPLGFTLRTIENPAGVRVVIEFSRRPQYEIRTGRNKIIMRIREGPVLSPFKKRSYDGDILDRIRFSGSNRGGDLIFYTEDEFGTFSSFEMGEPFRVVLDLRRRKAPPMAIGVPSPRRPGARPRPEGPDPDFLDVEGMDEEESPTDAPRIPTASAGVPSEEAFVVVIDPGHGGEDTGARGPSGLVEKFVTLDIARRLRERLLMAMDVEVILTRDTDREISLDERTALANHNRADLFVSIHANASRRPRARGAESYFLSYQATDDEARAVAAIENNTLGLDDGVPRGNGLDMVLWDIAQSAFLRESSVLAEVIQDNLNDALGITNRGIKQAPFRVLMGATMPAVLIEVAFISNADEEIRLRDPAFKDRLADAIFDSIERYHDKFLRPRDR
jgi:N-acetylmuramoyl-L-alanine amidase